MEYYTLYAVRNIFQLKKSQVDVKLNRGLRNVAKKYVIEKNLLGNEDVNSKNKAEDLEVKDEKNIAMSTTDSYSYAVTIACKH